MKDINLLPDELKKNVSSELEDGATDIKDLLEPKKILIALSVMFGLAVVFFAPLLINKYYENQYKEVQTRISSNEFDIVRQVNKELDEMQGVIEGKATVLNYIDRSNVSANEVLIALKSILPEGCSITSVNLTGEKVTVTGVMAEKIQVGEIISRAERYNFFKVDERTAVSYNDNNNFSFSFNVHSQRGG